MKFNLLLLATVALLESLVEARSGFESSSFSLSSSMYILPIDHDSYTRQVEENYSADQKRAKLKFKLIAGDVSNGPASGEIYYDSVRDVGLILNEKSDECKPISRYEIPKFLFTSQLQLDDSLDEYIIGPARILLFLMRNRDKLVLQERDEPVIVRNVHCLRYELPFVNQAGESFNLIVLYDKEAMFSDEHAIPLQVIISLPDSKIIIVDFGHLEVLSAHNSKMVGMQPLDDSYSRDLFAFPTLSGCSKVMAEHYNIADRLVSAKTRLERFSFQVELEESREFSFEKVIRSEGFVAFDSKLQLLRFDETSSESESGARQQIFDLKLGRIYHTMERVVNSANRFDKILDASSLPDDTQCVVAKIEQLSSAQAEPADSISRVLLGCDKFVYMGQARVRGVKAYLYETDEGSLPIWYDQIVKFSSTNEMMSRVAKYIRPDPSLTILLYFDQPVSEDSSPKLLQIEVFKFQLKSRFLLRLPKKKLLMKVFHFDWSLGNETPEGTQISEYFSLRELQSLDEVREDFSHAKIEMLFTSRLASNQVKVDDLLPIRSQRNLALLSELQSVFSTPATMIYDLESKFVSNPLSTKRSSSSLSLMLTFSLAERTKTITDFIFLGAGRLIRSDGNLIQFEGVTFKDCFFISAHRKVNIYFAYSNTKKICYVDLFTHLATPRFTADSAESSRYFKMETNSSNIDVFQTNHLFDTQRNREGIERWIDKYSNAESQLKFLGKEITLTISEKDDELKLKLVKIKVDNRNKFERPKTSMDGSPKVEKVAKISGFGYSANSANQNRYVEAGQSNASMSFDKCQASCLSDFRCNSFSVCIRNYQVVCVVSDLSINSSLAETLMKESNQVKESVELTIDGQSVKLDRHLNCDIYNKKHSELFNGPFVRLNDHLDHQVIPVADLEQCAEMCFSETIKVLRAENQEQIDMSASQILAKDAETISKMCQSFMYMDMTDFRSFSAELIETIRNQLIPEENRHQFNNLKDAEGFCMYKSTRDESGGGSVGLNVFLFFEQYSLKFDFFYEKQFGTRLLSQTMSKDFQLAYQIVSNGGQDQQPDNFNPQVVQSALDRGDNFQEVLDMNESRCADACFLQKSAPWPGCRSFDVEISQENGRYITRCFLNTITMKQAISNQRFDLIENELKPETQVWHFEPKSGFFDNLPIGSDVNQLDFISSVKRGLSIHAFGIFIIVVMGVASGISLGVLLAPRLIEESRRFWVKRKGYDSEKLVPIPTLEFSNQVNSECRIPE